MVKIAIIISWPNLLYKNNSKQHNSFKNISLFSANQRVRYIDPSRVYMKSESWL